MIELPEAIGLSRLIVKEIKGKRIRNVSVNQTPHKFAWFFGDPSEYDSKLKGKVIENAYAYGSFVEIKLGNIRLILSDGINLRYFIEEKNTPQKHQLLIQFDDKTVLVATVRMYGGIWCFEGKEFDYRDYKLAKEKPSPLSDEFDYKYFEDIILDKNLKGKSVKAVLATEQRIPGLGNGVLQDILFNAKIHPKRKVKTLYSEDIKNLYNAIKSTLNEMVIKGGRDTEKNLHGIPGGYTTKLSRKTIKEPCVVCGGNIVKKTYMGGSIYYCERCQKE